MFHGLIWIIATGVSWASISAVMSNVARYRVPTFLFYSIGAVLTAVMAWVFLVDWRAAVNMPLGDFLIAAPAFLIPGLINVVSQAVMVRTLKLGHNGLSVAIRNCAGTVPFMVGFLFLDARVYWFNWVGLLLITSGFVLITLSRKKSASDKKTGFSMKWLMFALASMMLSGTFQTFNTLATMKFNTVVKLGMATPLLMTCCAAGYISAFLIWQRDSLKIWGFSGQVLRYAAVWAVLALLSYYFMFKTLDVMRDINAAALVFPTVMGVNVCCFFTYSKFKLREPYTFVNICCLLMCLLGVVMLSVR